MTSGEPTSRRPGLLARLAQRSSRRRAVGLALSTSLVAVVAASCAWLLTPGSSTQRLPGSDALGSPAVGSYKAARDYAVVDEEATRELREAAAAGERPVFDLDDGAAEDSAARIHRAFEAMRRAAGDARAVGRREGGRPAADAVREQAGAGERELFGRTLGVRVDPASFATLARARFSEPLEGWLVALAGRALAGRVVDDRRALDAARERGIVVRVLRAGTAVREHVLSDVRLVHGLEETRAEVDRAAAALPPAVAAREREALAAVARALARPTLAFDARETAARQRRAAEGVPPVVLHVKRGEKIVGDGEVLERRHLVLFRGIRAQTRPLDAVPVRLGAAALVTTLVLLLWAHGRRAAGFRPARKDAVLLAVALVATAGLASAGLALGDALHDRVPRVAPETLTYLVPFAAGAMVLRSVLSAEVALLFSIASGAVVGLAAGNSVFLALHALLTSVAASGLVPGTRDRAGLFRVGGAVGLLGALLAVAAHLFTGRPLGDALAPAAAALVGGGVLLPVLTVGTLPLIEWAFGYLTDVKLLELANLNHPALKDLIVEAPGTYHHSVIMGSLVEAAAQAIGANALLARVCAYYHDLGKTRNPGFFAENQRGASRHEELAPSMSALAVKRHVTDGVELARHWGLPRQVAAAIPEHHGTRLVAFFWARAQHAAATEDAPPPDEALFRYAGPKPQSRETALVMIADACEASARALAEPTTERLRLLVQRRINEIFSEGQLDECALTLRDLNAIAGAILRALEGIYHARPGHPRPEVPPEGGAAPHLQLLVKGP